MWITVLGRILVPFLIGTGLYLSGCSSAWSIGLFFLACAAFFPVGKIIPTEPQPIGRIGFICPESIRKLVYPVILAGGITVCFFSILENSREPDAWKNDRMSLNLHGSEELDYSRKVWKADAGMRVFGNFTKESSVEADGRKLKRTEDYQQYLSDPETFYYDAVTYIMVSGKYRHLTAVTPRKIIRKLASPYWLFALLLAICLWSSCCETGLLKQESSPVKDADKLLLTVLAVASIAFITWMYGQLLPLKYTTDGPHYLSFTAGNPVAAALVSYRTPGYPLLLKCITYISPMNHNALIVVQYGLYFLALSWLVYELYKAGLPSAGSLALLIVFSRYMFCYHNFMLADSPGLTGIILLLAFSCAWYRKITAGCTGLQTVCWYIFGALLIFAQLMIKPFPGTIFIPGGLVFLMLIFQWKPAAAFRHAVLFSLTALILPLLFCGYRYWKTGDFNFASLSSFQMCSTAIILHDPGKTSQLDPKVRRDMESIVSETLKANPELVWPVNWERLKQSGQDYETYANRILYHPGLFNGSWLNDKGLDKAVSRDVGLELACKKMLSHLLPCMDWGKFYLLQRIYLKELGEYLRYPRVVAEVFAENSPFGKAGRVLFLFLLPLSAALYLGRWRRKNDGGNGSFQYNFQLIFMLAALAFVGVCGTVSTFLLVTPFIEVRREMIGLFSVFFGAFGMIVYSFCYLAVNIAAAILFRGKNE